MLLSLDMCPTIHEIDVQRCWCKVNNPAFLGFQNITLLFRPAQACLNKPTYKYLIHNALHVDIEYTFIFGISQYNPHVGPDPQSSFATTSRTQSDHLYPTFIPYLKQSTSPPPCQSSCSRTNKLEMNFRLRSTSRPPLMRGCECGKGTVGIRACGGSAPMNLLHRDGVSVGNGRQRGSERGQRFS